MRKFSLLLLALFVFIQSCDKTQSTETTGESTEGYTSTEIQLIPGVSFTSQITTSLDYNNRPSDDVSYVSRAQKKVYVYTNFDQISNGGHEYAWNVSNANQRGIVMNPPMNFQVTNGQHQVWSWVESNKLLGSGDYTMDVYLDGKLQFRKPFKILSKEEEASDNYIPYWLEKNYHPIFTTDSDKITEEWRVHDFYYLDSEVVSIIPVVHEGFNRMFAVLNTPGGDYELAELLKGQKNHIRELSEGNAEKIKFHSRLVGSELVLYNSFGIYDMKIDLKTGKWEPVEDTKPKVNIPNQFPSPNEVKMVVKSCEEGISVIINGNKIIIKELSCDGKDFGWATWNKRSSVFYFEDADGIYSYNLPQRKLTQILFQPNPTGVTYFENNGMDLLAFYADGYVFLATKHQPNAWFHDEFDYDYKFEKELVESNAGESLEISYYPEPIEILSQSTENEMEYHISQISEIGQIIEGAYADAKVLKLAMQWQYEDKMGPDLYTDHPQTYALHHENRLIFLTPHLSEKYQEVNIKDNKVSISDPGFALLRTDIFKNTTEFKVDPTSKVEALIAIEQTNIGTTPIKLLVSINGYDLDNFVPLEGQEGWHIRKNDDGSFNRLLPDGTRLVYTYDLEQVGSFDLSPYDTPLEIGGFIASTDRNCAGRLTDLANIEELNLPEMREIGSFGNGKLYAPFQTDHPLLQKNYKLYKTALEQSGGLNNEDNVLIDYDVFWEYTPIFFWEDGLGRFVQFRSKEFLPPMNCEPIVYFYPEEEQKINFTLGENIDVLASYPSYQDGWELLADPSGKFIDNKNGKRNHRIFWEGLSGYLPRLETGHVVAREDIDDFLTTRLTNLGLIEMEIEEFKEAWLEILEEKPFSFIGFYDQGTINQYAPIEITPTPDTMIRILMDFENLDSFKEVAPPVVSESIERNKFTVVEWGGLKR